MLRMRGACLPVGGAARLEFGDRASALRGAASPRATSRPSFLWGLTAVSSTSLTAFLQGVPRRDSVPACPRCGTVTAVHFLHAFLSRGRLFISGGENFQRLLS